MSSKEAYDRWPSRRGVLAGLAGWAAFPAEARAEPASASIPPWTQLPPTPGWPRPDVSGTLDLDGTEIFHARFGRGPAVLLLHGGMGSSDHWGHQIRHLSDRFSVIVMDTRGHGRSPFDDTILSYALFAQDAVRLLDLLGVTKVSVVGWSDGAITALELAMRHPDRVSRLFAFAGNVSRRAKRRCAGGCPTFVAYARRCRAEYATLSPKPERWPDLIRGLRTMWHEQPELEASALARIKATTVIADGQYDEIIKPAYTVETARLIPGARPLILPGTSHFAMLQAPALFNVALDRFLTPPAQALPPPPPAPPPPRPPGPPRPPPPGPPKRP